VSAGTQSTRIVASRRRVSLLETMRSTVGGRGWARTRLLRPDLISVSIVRFMWLIEMSLLVRAEWS